MIKVKTLIGLILGMLILSCNDNNNDKKQSDNFDYGYVENDIYTNEFFGATVNLPEAWIVQSKEQVENISNTGKNLIAGDNDNLKAAIKASEINSVNLLAAFENELGAAVDYNPSIMIIAENIKNLPGIKNGSDYLFQARRLIQQGQVKYDYLSENFEREIINETEFYKMKAEINYMGIEINQIYYSSIIKGFSFNVIISYVSDEQKEVLLKSLNSLKFKK